MGTNFHWVGTSIAFFVPFFSGFLRSNLYVAEKQVAPEAYSL